MSAQLLSNSGDKGRVNRGASPKSSGGRTHGDEVDVEVIETSSMTVLGVALESIPKCDRVIVCW